MLKQSANLNVTILTLSQVSSFVYSKVAKIKRINVVLSISIIYSNKKGGVEESYPNPTITVG